MEPFFSENHASALSQLGDKPHRLEREETTYPGWMDYARELSRQLRYREAILAYTQALTLSPGSREALRQRGGKYLATLQPERAMVDFERCRALGGQEEDLSYRMGMSWFYAGVYGRAMEEFARCREAAGEEMGIAAIYWSMIAAWRLGRESALLQTYRQDMAVGHHTAYAFVVKTVLGYLPLEQALWELDAQEDDLEFSMQGYGLAAYCAHLGHSDTAQAICQEILSRDNFWISFAFLAAWNDRTGTI